ncbi:MAG: TonB-dependent receptor, partial [Emcibacter sp.]|nr:TonB-dependent receptor [Emcibacter sp.]
MLTAASPAVYAAEEDTAKDDEVILEEVIVTGIRGSIINSIAKKRNNSSIVEALSAEDIGKLPDASIAESLARLPGLAAQRLDGRANVISIRGLAPDFTTTTLNGREQVSANNNRAVEFDQFPSELINSVVVHKTTDAKLTSQAVGGTIDLQTVRPLAHGERTIVLNMRGEYNDLGALNAGTSAWGYRGSFSYIDQFADDTIGIAIGYARMVSPTQEERWNSWGFPDHSSGNKVIGGAKPYVKSNELTRDGLMGVLEYEPNDQFNTTIDMYYSKFNDVQILRGIEIPLAWSGASLRPDFTASNGLITAGTWDGVEVVVRNDVVTREAETFSVGWNSRYEIDENWSVEADLSYSKVDRIEANMETYSGTGRGNGVGATDTLGFTLDENAGAVFSPGLDYSDPNLIQLGGPLSWGWGLIGAGVFDNPNGQDGFINRPSSNDDIKTIRLSAEHVMDNGFISTIDIGARYADRSKTLLDEGVFLTLKGFAADPDNYGTLPVPSEFLLAPTSLAFIGMGNVLSYDALALFKSGAYIETDESLSAIGRSTNSWTVNEKVLNLYVQANIDTEVGDIPLTGNIGLQAVHTNQQSNGFAARVGQVNGANRVIREPVVDGDKYWEFLPSLNLSFEVAEDQKLRVGVSRVLARPRMDQMNPGFSFGYDVNKASSTDINNSRWGGGGGNPKLRPFMSW